MTAAQRDQLPGGPPLAALKSPQPDGAAKALMPESFDSPLKHHTKPPSAPTKLDFREELANCNLSYVEARKRIARATRENYAGQIRAVESKSALEMERGEILERVKVAHTLGPAPRTGNQVDRMNQQALANKWRRAKTEEERAAQEQLMDSFMRMRQLYTGGELEAQQQGLDCIPSEVCSTLTLQLGTLKKINMPRNDLTLLLSIKTSNLSCQHLRSVVEMHLAGNKLRELPKEFGRLTALRHLDLSQNKLSALPPSMLGLTNLVHLNLRGNNFRELPYGFGHMKALEHLDVSDNVLAALPTTLPQLVALKHLNLDSNNLPHLAIPPPLKTERQTGVHHWAKRYHKEKKKEVWVNDLTGETSETDPRLMTPSPGQEELTEGTVGYNVTRNHLAEQGVYEWEAVLNPHTGGIQYHNNVNGVTVGEIPRSMDTLGKLASLTQLKVNHSKVRELPPSLCQCSALRVLEASDNFLERLPPNLGALTKLMTLRLSQNRLTQLPSSMAQCTKLVELNLTSNYFKTFPDFCMNLSSLKKLCLGNNQLKHLPYSVGFLTNLTDFQVFNNPLEASLSAVLMQGMEQLLWECRHRYLIQQRGAPPDVKVHGFGIQSEKLELEPFAKQKLLDTVERAKRTGEFHFFMEGITDLPDLLFQEELSTKLTSIRLDSNDLSGGVVRWEKKWEGTDKVWHEVTFGALVQLSLKSCKMTELDSSFCSLQCLRELFLEANALVELPRNFARLRNLEILDLRRNRLLDVPDDLGELRRLKRLELDANRLQVLPQSLSRLESLEVLTCSQNDVYALPHGITCLAKLHTLDMDGNQLTLLPPRFGELRLHTCKFAYNRLEVLEHDVFLPNLKDSLRVLWLSNNNLQELPASFTQLQHHKEVQVDSNPLVSPPVSMLSEGMAVVIQYCRIRARRMEDLEEIITDRGFKTSLQAPCPVAQGILTGHIGYLNPDDLSAFDAAVDSFINRDFYHNALTAERIVHAAFELKASRETEFYDTIVSCLYKVIEREEPLENFTDAVFMREGITKPWGRDKEEVGCFCLSLGILLADTMPSVYNDMQGRNSIWRDTLPLLPRSVFAYTKQVLKKALVTLRSAYGPIAAFEEVTYPDCECVNPETGEELNHAEGKCELRSLVLCKVVVTSGEAARREREDRDIDRMFDNIHKEVNAFLLSKDGVKSLSGELRRRKALYGLWISETDIKLNLMKSNLRAKLDGIRSANDRKRRFDRGEPSIFHQIESAEMAVQVVLDAEEEYRLVGVQIDQALARKEQLIHKRDNMSAAELAAEAQSNLIQKHCCLKHQALLTRNRIAAVKNGWRRPWDGMDGALFMAWGKENDLQAPGRHEMPDNYKRYKNLNDSDNPLDEWDAQGALPKPLSEKYSWENTEDMARFEFALWKTWAEDFKQRKKRERTKGRGGGSTPSVQPPVLAQDAVGEDNSDQELTY